MSCQNPNLFKRKCTLFFKLDKQIRIFYFPYRFCKLRYIFLNDGTLKFCLKSPPSVLEFIEKIKVKENCFSIPILTSSGKIKKGFFVSHCQSSKYSYLKGFYTTFRTPFSCTVHPIDGNRPI